MTCKWTVRIALVFATALTCASCGPRMREQISIQPFSRQMPLMPTGTVPTTSRLQTITAQQSKLKTNPMPKSQAVLDDGRIFYGYYCRQCHGANGDGNGPVGQSYVPEPADLSSSAVRKLNDGQFYAGMLHGVGHDPIMSQTVPLDQRWQTVAYARSFTRR